MNVLDKQLQKGSLFLVLLYAALTLFFIVYVALEPGYRYLSLFLIVIGSGGVWHHYTIWSKKRAQRGVESISTDSRAR